MNDNHNSKRPLSAADNLPPKALQPDDDISDHPTSDELFPSHSSPPLPAWAVQEALRRRDELLQHPQLALTHDDIWKRIEEFREG